MVAVQMGDEDGANLGKAQVGTAQLYLCSLAAVDEEQLAAHFHYL